MMPVFPFRTLLMLVLPVALAAGVLAAVGRRGTGVFKKQGVAWGLTVLMIFAAIGIGYAKAPFNYAPAPEPGLPSETVPPAAPAEALYVWDNADVLSTQTERELSQRNTRLWNSYSVSIGVVTCNYGKDDLDQYAMDAAEDMGLGGYDMIVALDISGDNYWLIQGNALRRNFTDNDCTDYAYDYMEKPFAKGDYDKAVLQLAEALENWYDSYFN